MVHDLADELPNVFRIATTVGFNRVAEDRDFIRRYPLVPAGAAGKGNALVEAEEGTAVPDGAFTGSRTTRVLIHHKHHVHDAIAKSFRNLEKRLLDPILELGRGCQTLDASR